MALLSYIVLFLAFQISAGASFHLVKQKKTFHDAERYCQQIGSHLASVHSDAENRQIYQMCRAVNQNCWIGFNLKNGHYIWTDGSSNSYNNFHPGEPDNWAGKEGCALLIPGSNYHGLWSDKECDASYDHSYFICGGTGGSGASTGAPHTHPPATHKPVSAAAGTRLSIRGSHFYYGNQRVFLSGINKAWEHYAYDFGDNQYRGVKTQYEQVLQQIHQSGGNSMRIWVHIEGETSPKFDSRGQVVGTDNSGTLISDLGQLLQAAERYNVFIFITLWNGAVKQNTHQRLDGLIKDTAKLQSYLDNALIPMVKGLKNYPALGGWDIMNEPEGELKPDVYSADPCYDTRFLQGSGAGWAGKLYSAQEIQRFINWQTDAIRRTDPQALVSVGAWNGKVNTDQFGFHNLYKDECLKKAGGKSMGTLNYYQIHSYSYGGHFGTESPFLHNFSEFGLDKPVVIGEFREKNGAGMTINELYDHAYLKGYAGGWGWSETDGNMSNMRRGIAHIRNYHDQSKGGNIYVNIN